MIRYAKLPLSFAAELAQSELLMIVQGWLPHFNTSYYEGSWSVIALRSAEGKHENIIPELMGGPEYSDTIYMSQFPSVIKLLSELACPVMSVRFLKLEAGAVIKQHRDNELAFEKGEARLHFPIVTNPQVFFYVEDERIILNAGECWYLNANLPHRVTNKGITDRIHLVIDCKVNEWLSNIINQSPVIAYKNENITSDLLNIIKELRLQDTDTSHQLANELELQLKESGDESLNN